MKLNHFTLLRFSNSILLNRQHRFYSFIKKPISTKLNETATDQTIQETQQIESNEEFNKTNKDNGYNNIRNHYDNVMSMLLYGWLVSRRSMIICQIILMAYN